jgi:hypothetical protein
MVNLCSIYYYLLKKIILKRELLGQRAPSRGFLSTEKAAREGKVWHSLVIWNPPLFYVVYETCSWRKPDGM